ncbi:hypothetical protein NE237_029293 [Protea cynaroides]|uniref:Putative invertase inhibitor n=1 Tax=Protea cynaroides TaxID=273540 RepID=A0A9Q0GQW7_9MAGN|nr:hypothetical protein NE237_029293 [Protea cynaroides]
MGIHCRDQIKEITSSLGQTEHADKSPKLPMSPSHSNHHRRTLMFPSPSFPSSFLHVVDADIVSDTCQNAAQRDTTLNLNFCLKVLGEDPKSHSTDLQGLGIISLNLILNNATNIGSRIVGLLNDQTVAPDVKKGLKICQDEYSEASSSTKEAIDAFNSKDYDTTNIYVSGAKDSSSDCEDGFKGLKSPLTAENNSFFQLTAIVLSITNMF